MNSIQNDICPLGPHLQHYWDRLSDTEKRMEFDEEGLFSLALEPIALEIAQKTSGKVVADAFCGVGGMAIGLCKGGEKSDSHRSKQKRLGMAKRNAALFGVEDKIDFILGDVLKTLPATGTDAVF